MKKLATAIAAIALIGTPAFAATPKKRPPPPPLPAPVYSWTGWYVGLNVGYGFGRASADVNYFAGSRLSTVCGSGALCINGSNTVDMNGLIGGVQVGYNWQAGTYLAGIEADFQGSGQRGAK